MRMDRSLRVNKFCHLQREAFAGSTEPQSVPGAGRLVILLATLLGAAGYCLAQGAAEKPETRLGEVVINAARTADEQVTRQVEKKLANDPWIFSEHITVTTRNGVVHLEGIVGDTGEWFRLLDLCRRIPGAWRVVSELEIMHNDPDGG